MQERRNQQKLVLNKASINFDDKRETEETRDKNTTKQSSMSYISGFLK